MLKIEKDQQVEVEVFDGVKRCTLACGKDILMAKFKYTKGSKVPPHKHSYEQVTTILKGKQKITIKVNGKKKEFTVNPGESYIVPASFEHEQGSITESITIDAWSLSP